MKDGPLPDKDNIVRHCKPQWIDEDGDITSAAFKLRKEKDEDYLSVCWVEFFSGFTFNKQIDALKRDLSNVMKLKSSQRLAHMNVGHTRDYVASNTKDSRTLVVKHLPSKCLSHSGIYNTEPDEAIIAELLAETILGTYQAT